MNRTKMLTVSVGLALALSVGTSASAQAPAYGTEEYDSIIEQSRQEGPLRVYGNMTVEAWAPALALFNELYPWITVETLDIPSAEIIERYLAERGTGSASADFLVSTSMEAWVNLLGRNGVLDYESPEADDLPAIARPAPGLYAIASDPMLLVWNKLALPEELVPTSIANLAEIATENADFLRGRITTYAPDINATGFQSHYSQVLIHGDTAWEWFDAIAPLVRGETSSGPMLEKLISGEYVIGYNMLPGNLWLGLRDPALAEVLDWRFVSDGAYLSLRTTAIPTEATNVNSAKLLLDVLLSREGQIALAEGGRTPIRPDVSSEDVGGNQTYTSVAEAVGEENLLTLPYDQSFIDGRAAFVERWLQAQGR